MPKEFGTQQKAHVYIITIEINAYDKIEKDSKFWYFINTGEIVNPTNIKLWTIKKFDAKTYRNEFFPAMRFRQIEYCVWILEIEYANQIAKFIPTLRKGNMHVFTISCKGDISDPLYVKVYNY
jgi:hypothetical protein